MIASKPNLVLQAFIDWQESTSVELLRQEMGAGRTEMALELVCPVNAVSPVLNDVRSGERWRKSDVNVALL